MRELTVDVDGVKLHVDDHGAGTPVVLLHGFPDSSYLWRNQIPFLVEHGFRVVAPDLRGFGSSDKPSEVAAYALPVVVGDVVAILDALSIQRAHIVGHDWGAAVAWLLATLQPDRVDKLVVLSVPHLSVPRSLRAREMAWYQLFFQFEGVAEETIAYDDWAFLREWSRGDGDLERWIEDLSRPGALRAGLNWYRANLAPRPPGPGLSLPPVQTPTLGIWSSEDHYLDGERMRRSAEHVAGPWRYEQLDGVSHWMQVEAPDRLNALLLEWLT
jgi:pimeloyl-ACP methyl ester carboxylesterase